MKYIIMITSKCIIYQYANFKKGRYVQYCLQTMAFREPLVEDRHYSMISAPAFLSSNHLSPRAAVEPPAVMETRPGRPR